MLVLTRKTDQSIIIGDPKSDATPIEVKITEIRGDQVKLGITAPSDVLVDRTEIRLDIQENGRRELT